MSWSDFLQNIGETISSFTSAVTSTASSIFSDALDIAFPESPVDLSQLFPPPGPEIPVPPPLPPQGPYIPPSGGLGPLLIAIAEQRRKQENARALANQILTRLRTATRSTPRYTFPHPIDYITLLRELYLLRNQLIPLIRRGRRFSILFGDVWKVVDPSLLNNLDTIVDNILTGNQDTDYMDPSLIQIHNNRTLSNALPQIEIMVDSSPNAPTLGGFFPYVITAPEGTPNVYDMSTYQIYNEQQLKDLIPRIEHQDTCLLNSLKVACRTAGLSIEPKIPVDLVKEGIVSSKHLDTIAELNNLRIVIVKDDLLDNNTYHPQKDNGCPKVYIGRIESHYVPYTKGFYEYIGWLAANKYLRAMTYKEYELCGHSSLVSKELIPKQFPEEVLSRPFEKKDLINNDSVRIYYDFETTTEGDRHIPFMLSYKIGSEPKVTIRGVTYDECASLFLETLQYKFKPKPRPPTTNREKEWCRQRKRKTYQDNADITLLAHNASYDLTFLFPHVTSNGLFGSASSVKGANLVYKNLNIRAIDTYRFLGVKLADMPAFVGLRDLTMTKAIMPYSLYTQETIIKDSVPLQMALSCLGEGEEEDFMTLAWDYIKDGSFRHMDYAQFYCERDVDVLYHCVEHFANIINEGLGMNLFDFFTIPSLSDRFFYEGGAFEGVHEIGGSVRDYIQRAVSGGRSHTFMSEKIEAEGRIVDFDAVSLYPSAIVRLAGQIPKGAPKVATKDQLNMTFLSQQTTYFATVRVFRYRRHISFPPLYMDVPNTTTKYKYNKSTDTDEDKEVTTVKRKYLYELPEGGYTSVMSRIKLEDIINYHRLQPEDYEILDAVYFDEGSNDTFCSLIEEVFNQRKERKAAKDPLQQVLKLILNSAYGKTLEKPHDESTVLEYFKDDEDRMRRLSRGVYRLKEYSIVGDNKMVVTRGKVKNIHMNRVHIGVLVLDMSKRIMYELLDVMEDLNVPCLYIDTDSTHFAEAALPLVESEYRIRYSRELIGENMGQFHVDFDLPGSVGPVVSTHFIGIAPKVYLDVLEGKDAEGNTITGHHIRAKGIPLVSIEDYCENTGLTEVELYQRLKKGYRVSFNMLAKGRVSFKRNKDLSIRSENIFCRELQFPD